MAASLEELILTSRSKLQYPYSKDVQVVLEEDGTEVDDDEYFQTLDPNTTLMLLYQEDRWSPFVSSGDVTDHGDNNPDRLNSLLLRWAMLYE